MTWSSRAIRWFNDIASNPPSWMGWTYLPIAALMAFAAMQQRGWLIGAVAAVMFGGRGLAMALNPGGVISWSRNHPKTGRRDSWSPALPCSRRHHEPFIGVVTSRRILGVLLAPLLHRISDNPTQPDP